MKASIDCGTNSFRLLIVDDAREPVAAELIITRLGERVHETRMLQPQAIERSVDALTKFKVILDRHAVTAQNVRAVATSAARDAGNGDTFLQAAQTALGGTPLEILTGDQEATTTFKGVAANGITGPLMVVDIGGGSTELAFGHEGELHWTVSFDIGSVRLTELALHSDPYTAGEIAEARQQIAALVNSVELAELPDNTTLAGVAGSTTSLAAISANVTQWATGCVDGMLFQRAALDGLIDRLSTMTNAERLNVPLLVEGRADVIVAGGLILQSVMHRLQLQECRISERDLLFGLLV